MVKYEQDGQAKSFREFVAVIQDDVNGLQLTGQGGIISTSEVPGGQRGFGSEVSLAPRVVQVTGEDAVLFANPADKVMYYYREGMAAPMGNFTNYGRQPRAAMGGPQHAPHHRHSPPRALPQASGRTLGGVPLSEHPRRKHTPISIGVFMTLF